MLGDNKNIYCMWYTKATLEGKKKKRNELPQLNQQKFLHIIKEYG